MEIGIAYSAEGRSGSYFFTPNDTTSIAKICSETARNIRNACILVGPTRIEITSAGNLLGRHAAIILRDTHLRTLSGDRLLGILNEWRGEGCDLVFSDGNPRGCGKKPFTVGKRRRRGPDLPALILNIGQSEIKASMVYDSDRIAPLFARPWLEDRHSSRAQKSIVAQISAATQSALEQTTVCAGELSSVIYSVSSIVRERDISTIPNGFTKNLTRSQIFELKDSMRSIPSALGHDQARVEFLNDGFLLAMCHAETDSPGSTLSVRIGTSTCGGLDDEELFGEIGWVAPAAASLSDSLRFSSQLSNQPALARDLLSADAVLGIPPEHRAQFLASSLHVLIAEMANFHHLTKVVLCGSLLNKVDRQSFEHHFSQIAEYNGLSFPDVVFSDLVDHRDMLCVGILKMAGRKEPT